MVHRRRIWNVVLALLVLPCTGCAGEKETVPGATYLLDATMTTSDGVKLVMDIILPPGEGPFPVMLWRNPYNKDGVTYGDARQFVEAGYAAVSQDSRGRCKSEGVWDPFRFERRDGWETQEWIGKQKWCNGSIGLSGGSYLGFTQCISAPEASRYLKAMVPEVPWGNTYDDCLYSGGCLHLLLAMSWGSVMQMSKVGKPAPDFEKENLFKHLPLKTWDDCLGEKVPYLRDWVAHPTHDEYWMDHEVGDRIENITCAGLYFGGWFDIFTDGVLEYWSAARTRAKSSEAREHQYLIMGPWTHGGSQKDGQNGDLNFGSQSHISKTPLRMDFLNEMVCGKPTGFSKTAPLQIFVMGANRWRNEQEWPLARTQYKSFFLTGTGPANSSTGQGSLSWDPPTGPGMTDSYTYNPDDPVPTEGGALLWPTAGPRDQTKIEQRQDVLVYSSPILSETVEVTGPVRVKLFAATSAKDTDFTAKLVDIYPGEGGKETPYGITDGILRARFRESDKETSLVEPGKVYEYTVELGNTSIAFLPGHRIRLEVSSSNFPKYDRNTNTGNPAGEDATGIPATQTIHRSAEYPSHLVLPVIGN